MDRGGFRRVLLAEDVFSCVDEMLAMLDGVVFDERVNGGLIPTGGGRPVFVLNLGLAYLHPVGSVGADPFVESASVGVADLENLGRLSLSSC